MESPVSGKNPYDSETPEWQLFENMASLELQALAFGKDAAQYLEKAVNARNRALKFKNALARLSGDTS